MFVLRVMMMFCVLLAGETGGTCWGAALWQSLNHSDSAITTIDSRSVPLLPMCVDPIGMPIVADSIEHPSIGNDPDRRTGLLARDDDGSILLILAGSLNYAPHDDALVRSRQARLIRGPPLC